MRPEVKAVKTYWQLQSRFIQLDTDVLTECINSLSSEERMVLLAGDQFNQHESYVFIMCKVFNRHNDVIGGATQLERVNGRYIVTITKKSSITELDIKASTLHNCNKNGIYKICDVNGKHPSTLSFDALTELSASIIRASVLMVDMSCEDVTPISKE